MDKKRKKTDFILRLRFKLQHSNDSFDSTVQVKDEIFKGYSLDLYLEPAAFKIIFAFI